MTNALRPSELLAFRWKCFAYEASTLKIMETVYKGKFVLGENQEESYSSSYPKKLGGRYRAMA